jgi:carbonic anhydrase/acetyltransferase-like protein (isoleucine patch superfamily)
MPAPLLLPYAGIAPHFASPPVHAGPRAAVLGRATIGRNAWLGARTVIRADGNEVRTGDDVHLGAGATLHIAHDRYACIIGDRVTVGANACVHACTVGSDVFIGDNVVILDGAVVEDNVILESNTTVFPSKHIAGGAVYAGIPARRVRAVEPGEIAARRAQVLRERAAPVDMPATDNAIAPASAIDPTVFIASTARVRGLLRAATQASIFFSNDLDAGAAVIEIGARTNVQDNTVIRSTTGQGITIGPDTTVGHNVTINDCIIGAHTLIGIGSVVAQGTVIGDHVLLAASARTEPGQVLETGFLYAGSPARKRVPLDREKRAMIPLIVAHYCRYARDYMDAERAPVSAD